MSLAQNIGMRIGYARVSAVNQNQKSQTDALEAAACNRIITEKVYGLPLSPQLDKLLGTLGAEDVLSTLPADRGDDRVFLIPAQPMTDCAAFAAIP